MMKLKKELRITINGTKQDLKQWYETMAFTLSEYSKFAPYSNTKIVEVNDKKLLNLIKTNLQKLDGIETDLSNSKIWQDEADKRYQAELDRRKVLNWEEFETTEFEVEKLEVETPEVETTPEVDPFADEK